MASATMTARFCNLPADKREHITTAATTEFARHGYEQADTNRIAKEADLSVGVPFKYFPTKADLFLYVVRKEAEIIEAKTTPGFGIGCGVLEIVGKLVDVIGETSASEREAVQMYQAMTAHSDRAFAKETAAELERYTLKQYLAVLEEGRNAVRYALTSPQSSSPYLWTTSSFRCSTRWRRRITRSVATCTWEKCPLSRC